MTDKVYIFVQNYIHEYGYPPSIREIAKGCYINKTYAVRYLDILEAQGRLTRQPGKARGMRLTE
jgi:SOS-response transcriptional repressor LexA